jgi:hypothetical protein
VNSPTENDPPRNGTGPAQKQPRTIRIGNAALLAAASLVLGVGIGAAGTTSTATPEPSATDAASGTQTAELSTAPTAEPTPVETVEPTTEPTIEPTSAPTPEPARPIVVKGKGTQKTKPFDMPDGDFTVVVTGSGDGNVIVDLVPRGGEGSANLFNEISNGKYKYETVVYGVVAGSYYLDVTNSNAWVVTFTPLE